MAAGRAAQFGSAWTTSSVSGRHRCLGEIIVQADATAGSVSVKPRMALEQFNQSDPKEKVK